MSLVTKYTCITYWKNQSNISHPFHTAEIPQSDDIGLQGCYGLRKTQQFIVVYTVILSSDDPSPTWEEESGKNKET